MGTHLWEVRPTCNPSTIQLQFSLSLLPGVCLEVGCYKPSESSTFLGLWEQSPVAWIAEMQIFFVSCFGSWQIQDQSVGRLAPTDLLRPLQLLATSSLQDPSCQPPPSLLSLSSTELFSGSMICVWISPFL